MVLSSGLSETKLSERDYRFKKSLTAGEVVSRLHNEGWSQTQRLAKLLSKWCVEALRQDPSCLKDRNKVKTLMKPYEKDVWESE